MSCPCMTCDPSPFRFVVCPTCGNKRCPHATDHRHACTGSNEPGQLGSVYGVYPHPDDPVQDEPASAAYHRGRADAALAVLHLCANHISERLHWAYDGRPLTLLTWTEKLTSIVEGKQPPSDDPLYDGTGAAHPAYWRGEEAGIHGACMRVEESLSGTNHCNISGKHLRATCARVYGMRDELASLRDKVGTLQMALDLARKGAPVYAFQVGDGVRKRAGYKYPGVVVAAFPTLAGEVRYVVECTAPGCERMLHIFNGDQLERVP